MQVQVKILVENTTPAPGLIGEYGFAAYIAAGDKSILFDTGSAGALINNSRILGVELDKLDALVISHGHFDHTGAVMPVVEMNPALNVYAHSGIFKPHYVDHGVGNPIPIGTSFSLKDLQKKGAVFHEVNSFTEIMPSIYVTGGIPRTNNFEDAGFGFKTEINGEIVADNISDDSALVIRLPEGLVIISGCAHAGLINTINYCLQQTGCDKVLAYIGGTHLAMASEERIQKTIEALQALSIDIIATAHCTGFIPAAKMQQALGSKLIKAETGMVFNY